MAKSEVSGSFPHDAAADAPYPVPIGGVAATSTPTAVSAGDAVQAYFDAYGQLHVVVGAGTASSIIGAVDMTFTPVGAHNDGLNISSAATIATPATATKWMVQAITQNARFTLDGTVPTATCGFQLYASDPPLVIPISATTTIKVIQEAATCDLQYIFGY